MCKFYKYRILKTLFWLPLVLVLGCFHVAIGAQKMKATIVKIHGTVLVMRSGSGPWEPATKWMILNMGSRVKTTQHAFADILLRKRALIRIAEDTEVQVMILNEKVSELFRTAGYRGKIEREKGTLVKLKHGKIYVLVKSRFKGLPMIVTTPIGMAGVSGTRFVVDYTEPDKCILLVWKGKVYFWNPEMPEKSVLVKSKSFSRIIRNRVPSKPGKLNKVLYKKYREVEKLHLGLEIMHFGREAGSRYRGQFPRGYSPTEDDSDMAMMDNEEGTFGMMSKSFDSSGCMDSVESSKHESMRKPGGHYSVDESMHGTSSSTMHDTFGKGHKH